VPNESVSTFTAVPAIGTATTPYRAPLAPPFAPSQLALAEVEARAGETLEQLAEQGDGLAVAKLAQANQHAVPVEQRIGPAQHPSHAPGATEFGKGQLIDEYD
jgi:hypothetical protein